ncbi:RNA polymerase sigma factor [soil metagenome]
MSAESIAQMQTVVDEVYRQESRRVLATLIRLLGDFDLAEDALQDAFASALKQWPVDGIPVNPRAWLVSAGRFKAIDNIRRRARFDKSLPVLAEQLDDTVDDYELVIDDDRIVDDRLRLIFTCCHPALSPEARIALTLREVCGLTTEEIARAFLTSAPTLAQRIVRAKNKIRDAGIPYQVPGPEELPERLGTVLHVIYLVFNEGYSASAGDVLVRADLSGEAIRLAALLLDLMPDPEVMGLLGLMLLHESRREARTTGEGDLILLEDQDRTLWNRQQIKEGSALAEGALATETIGPYAIQAAIAATHANAATPAATDWTEIANLYTLLSRATPTPIVELNRAVAIAMRDGPAAGLEIIEQLMERGELGDYHLAHSARAELHRRLGNVEKARSSYERALALANQEPERRFLMRRISEVSA